MKKYHTFYPTKECSLTEHIRWCRMNLGERGQTWDFTGGMKKVEIIIYSEEAEFTYILIWK